MSKGVDPVSVQQAAKEVGRGFRIDDQVSLTALRRSAWLQQLAERGKLRLSDHATTVGVVVTPDVWRRVEELVDAVNVLLQRLEEEDIERLWQERAEHARRPADMEGGRLLALLGGDETR